MNIKSKIAKVLRGWCKKLDPEFYPVDLPPVDPCINLHASVYDINRIQVRIDITRDYAQYVTERIIGADLSKKIAEAMLEGGVIKITRENNPDGSCRFLAEAYVGKNKDNDRQF